MNISSLYRHTEDILEGKYIGRGRNRVGKNQGYLFGLVIFEMSVIHQNGDVK